MEPIDWSILNPEVFEEIIHRFHPKAVLLLTASCPSILTPLLESQIPTLAVRLLDQKCFICKLSKHFLHVTEELFFSATFGPVVVLIQGFSSKHEAWYRDNASKALFKLMCQAKSRHYQPEVVKAIKDTKKQDDDQVNPEPKRKTRGGGGRTSEKTKRKSRGGKAKGKERGKGKGKGSKKQKADVDEGDEEEDFPEEDEGDSILFEPSLPGMFLLLIHISLLNR